MTSHNLGHFGQIYTVRSNRAVRVFEVLRRHSAFRSIMFAQLLARAPIGMWPIAILLLVEERTGSYALAGVVVALMTAGRALGTPIVSRSVDRWGLRLVVGVCAVGSSLAGGLLAVASATTSWPAGLVVHGIPALVAGLLNPPVQPVVRAVLPRLVPDELRAEAFAVDASAQEIIFVLGPLLSFGIAGAADPGWSMVAGAVLQLAGAGWLLTVARSLPAPAPSRPTRRRPVLFLRPVLAGAAVGLLLVAANSAVEAAVAAHFSDHGLLGGTLLAVYSLASLLGGLLLARWTGDPWAQARWLAVVAVGLWLAAFWLEPWWLAVTLALAGAGVAPVFAAVAGRVSTACPPERATEAFGWLDSGAIVGASLGFAVAGIVIGSHGAQAAFGLAAGLALVAGLLAALTRARAVPAGNRAGRGGGDQAR